MLSKRVRWRLIGFDASLRRGTLREQPLEHAPREPDHAAVLADLDPDFHRLPIGVPAGVLGKADWGNGASRAILFTEEERHLGDGRERCPRERERCQSSTDEVIECSGAN
jgi:hypothetical protein